MDYQALNEKLTAELGADNAQIQTPESQLKVTIANSVLFPEGGYERPGDQLCAGLRRATARSH